MTWSLASRTQRFSVMVKTPSLWTQCRASYNPWKAKSKPRKSRGIWVNSQCKILHAPPWPLPNSPKSLRPSPSKAWGFSTTLTRSLRPNTLVAVSWRLAVCSCSTHHPRESLPSRSSMTPQDRSRSRIASSWTRRRLGRFWRSGTARSSWPRTICWSASCIRYRTSRCISSCRTSRRPWPSRARPSWWTWPRTSSDSSETRGC